MEQFSDLGLVLKNYAYQERDRIVVCLTESHGRVTALAKGAIHSRRFGGTLDFLACSRFKIVRKPHAEMARIDEAITHHEFTHLSLDFERLTAASFCAEFCMRLIEPWQPAREIFVLLSNVIYHLDAGMPVRLAVNAFLCKSFKHLGYSPSLLRCVACARGAHEITTAASHPDGGRFFWDSKAGGMLCGNCFSGLHSGAAALPELSESTLLYFHKLTMTPFKELKEAEDESDDQASRENDGRVLYRLLADFLHQHLPGLPAGGFKSWRLLNDAILS